MTEAIKATTTFAIDELGLNSIQIIAHKTIEVALRSQKNQVLNGKKL